MNIVTIFFMILNSVARTINQFVLESRKLVNIDMIVISHIL